MNSRVRRARGGSAENEISGPMISYGKLSFSAHSRRLSAGRRRINAEERDRETERSRSRADPLSAAGYKFSIGRIEKKN